MATKYDKELFQVFRAKAITNVDDLVIIKEYYDESEDAQ